ncbi:MAG: FtsW/RodA/SpoVE family cell cycle protein [Tannerella sp.]|jgi:cell division protein FtsW|nr:FtsW/RodA/SpoVE family cell cycle protein [Tannerella sp.]
METNNRAGGLSQKLFCGDTTIWIIFLLLACCSLVEVFSATSSLAYGPKSKSIWEPIMRHASFLGAGFLAVFLLSRAHYKFFSLAILLLPLSFFMLFATFIVGIKVHDASRFLSLFGVQFQPSEIGKLAGIVYVAFLLSRRRRFSDDKVFKWIVWGVAPVCALIFPTNLSTTLLLGSVCFLLMFIGQIPYLKLGKLLLWVAVLGAVFVSVLAVTPRSVLDKYVPPAVHWQIRVYTWGNRLFTHLGSEKAEDQANRTTSFNPTDDDYQIAHAKAAIATGGVWGKGPGRSIQRDFLPQPYSDFIYAIIIEELGVILGGLGVLALYVMLMIRVGMIARKCKRLFPKYLVIGCGLIIVVQAMVHMAVNVGLAPVTGQPLPLISRGGTSTLLTCAYIGMILSISHYGAGMGETDEADGEEENWPEETETYPETNPIFTPEPIVSEE